MTNYLGNKVSYGSSGQWWVWLDATHTPATTASTVTVTVKVMVTCTQSMSDNDNSASWNMEGNTGTANDFNYSTGSGNTWQIGIEVFSPTVNYGSTKTIDLDATVDNLAGSTGPSTVSVNYVLPARLPDVPTAPGWASGTPTNVTDDAATLDWTAPSSSNGASIDRYHLQVDNNSGFTSLFYENTDAGGSRTITGMNPATAYYARVRAHNSEGYGPWSSTRSWTTDVGVPEIVGGRTTTSITSTSAVANWDEPSSWNGNDTDWYDLQYWVANQYDDTNVIIGVSNATSRTMPNLLPFTNYEWRVRAKNSAGVGAWPSTNATFKTLSGLPGQADPPTVSDITSSTAKVTSGAAATNGSALNGWQIQVDNNSDFASPNLDVTVTVDNATATGLAQNTVYRARTRAKNANGYGSWSAAYVFTTKVGTPAAPTLAVASSTDLTVTWTPLGESAGDVTYTVQVSTDPNFAAGTITEATNLQGPSHTFTGLSPGTTVYYARVRGTTAQGTGSYSPTGTSSTVSDDYIKVGGVWRLATWYIKKAGTWRLATVYVKKSGVWRS